jgi:hypothetical protein
VLPVDAAERKALPLAKGVVDYFPDALAAVAEVSRVGNDQHNPGQPLHWERSKSTDHADCIMRHLIERGQIDADGLRHSAKLAWRALALLQVEIETAAVANAILDDARCLDPDCCSDHVPAPEAKLPVDRQPRFDWDADTASIRGER